MPKHLSALHQSYSKDTRFLTRTPEISSNGDYRPSIPLLLRSSKAVTKETMQMTPCFGRPSLDPRFGTPIELRGSYLGRLFNLISISKALPSERIASEKAPP